MKKKQSCFWIYKQRSKPTTGKNGLQVSCPNPLPLKTPSSSTPPHSRASPAIWHTKGLWVAQSPLLHDSLPPCPETSGRCTPMHQQAPVTLLLCRCQSHTYPDSVLPCLQQLLYSASKGSALAQAARHCTFWQAPEGTPPTDFILLCLQQLLHSASGILWHCTSRHWAPLSQKAQAHQLCSPIPTCSTYSAWLLETHALAQASHRGPAAQQAPEGRSPPALIPHGHHQLATQCREPAATHASGHQSPHFVILLSPGGLVAHTVHTGPVPPTMPTHERAAASTSKSGNLRSSTEQ
jgi:hypothetical protein